jgi:hypothetical protein
VARVRLAWAAVAIVVVVVAWDFLAATTFVGDDHVFLAFARHAPSPWAPFVADLHGGEYYRPLPMALWWLLGRTGGALRFAILALALHLAAAALVTACVTRWQPAPDRLASICAGALFLAAPATRDAALWFSASTDLLATTFTLAALLAMSGGRVAYVGSLVLAALAYLSKESALALPLLGLALLGRRALPHLVLAGGYLAVRLAVLGGWGGAGDERASVAVRAAQIGAGLVRGLFGEAPVPALALALGGAALAWAAWGAIARARAGERMALRPLVWIGLAALPLAGAGWVVGTRYFYLPAVGLAWLLGNALAARGPLAAGGAVAFLLAAGSVRAVERRAEIAAYRTRVAVAAEAVAAARDGGHSVVHVRSGIKDLDLAVKERLGEGDYLVLCDVPASFVLMPPALAARARFLLAAPPLPPSGAYRFGTAAVVGLARRDESPALDEVMARLPEIRFVELVAASSGLRWRDVTAEKRAR